MNPRLFAGTAFNGGNSHMSHMGNLSMRTNPHITNLRESPSGRLPYSAHINAVLFSELFPPLIG
ncbi:hypothetical protein [Maridesulfovibrio ferrireducens]|uniref:hypothetical protein n=1 Tax=Maridesulfovibrio ferrireducens TaxID=246191 RepID=UPI001A22AD12|nr:hypothetical protein [Maridesulfovibrio ferrireducens]MBI9110881.1 hypothetical protein [Maridesulfovibrio ferrireducens]